MKNSTYNFVMRLMLVVSISFFSVSCGDDDDDKKDNPKYSVSRVDTYAITPTFIYGKYLVNHPTGNPTLENTWGTKGVSFHVYVLQGNTFTDIGTLHSTETSIANADRKKPVHINVPIPTSIDVSKPYKVIAADDFANFILSNNKIVIDVDLKRGNTYCPGWYVAQGGASATSQSNYLITYEALFVTNNTGKSIKVKHKGFEVMDKWYSKKGRVSITPSLEMEANVVSNSGDMTSEEITVNAGENNFIASTYVPTGKNMTNARLVLEIDGKEVKTPIVSSEVNIEHGNYYRMDVKWDGTNLEWD